jgi:serine/threonine protein kinase
MFDLREHGFTNCILSDDLHDLSNNLPQWNLVPRINHEQVGTKNWDYIKFPLVGPSGELFLPAFEWGNKLDEGTYGKIYLANRKIYKSVTRDEKGKMQFRAVDSPHQIVIKESQITLSPEELKEPAAVRLQIINEEVQTLIHEAAVMTLAHIALKKVGLEQSIPRAYELFLKTQPVPIHITDIGSVCISMEYIHGNTLLKYMRIHFKHDRIHNDKIFLGFVKQMATILKVLQDTLRMNHRDIKINNILLRDPDSLNPTIVLIDYGFACIANGVQEPNAEMSNIEAGAFFGSRYACFKHGRDMCQFLYSLHCYFPFDQYLSLRCLDMVRAWMSVPCSTGVVNLLNGISHKGHGYLEKQTTVTFDEGIYYFLRRPEVDPLHCSPGRILKDIEHYEQRVGYST